MARSYIAATLLIWSCILITQSDASIDPNDLAVLQDFWSALAPKYWLQSCGWNFTNATDSLNGAELASISSGPTSDPCCNNSCAGGTWFGITCSGTCEMTGQRVVGLALPENVVVGCVPDSIATLPLIELNLGGNDLLKINLFALVAAGVPTTLLNLSATTLDGGWPSLEPLTNIQIIDLSFTTPLVEAVYFPYLGNHPFLRTLLLSGADIYGPFPDYFNNTPALTTLEAGSNYLFGPLPDSFCKLKLELFSVAVNALSGAVPACVGDMPLYLIDISFNRFSYFDPSLWEIPTMSVMNLGVNFFTQEIPASTILMPNLTAMAIELNQLTGTFPDFSGSPILYDIELAENRITGPLPDSLCTLPALKRLNLYGNAFSGSIPRCLAGSQLKTLTLSNSPDFSDDGAFEVACQMPNLQVLQLNQMSGITGTIPACLNQTKIYLLSLIDTGIHGSIPAELFSLSLENLAIQNNPNLTGVIPDTIGDVGLTLEGLSLADNNLQGTLPRSITSLKNLVYLSLANNNFTGYMPDGWDLSCTPIIEVALNGNHFDLISADGTIIMPTLWSMDTDCKFHGLTNFLNIAGLNAQRYSFNTVLESLAENIVFYDRCGAYPIPLQYLNVAGMNVSAVSPYMLALVNSLIVLDMSGNGIDGLLPYTAIPGNLVMWDLAGNNFSGPIPEVFENTLGTSLTHLFLTDNPLLGAPSTGCAGMGAYCLPHFLAANFQTSTLIANGSCYGVTDSVNGISDIELDPSFYNFELCQCPTGTVGAVETGCLSEYYICEIIAATSPAKTCVQSVDITDTGATTVLVPNAWPSPNMTHATQFLPCDSAFADTGFCQGDHIVCNVTSIQTGGVQPYFTFFCTGEPCQPNYSGRLCSACTDHYYQADNGQCIACPTSPSSVTLIFTLAGFFIIVISFILMMGATGEGVKQNAQCFTCRVAIHYLWYVPIVGFIVIGTNAITTTSLTVLSPIMTGIYLIAVLQAVNQYNEDKPTAQYLRTSILPFGLGLLKSFVVFYHELSGVDGLNFLRFAPQGGPSAQTSVFASQTVFCNFPALQTIGARYIGGLLYPFLYVTIVFICIGIWLVGIAWQTKAWQGPLSLKKFRHTAEVIGGRGVAVIFTYINVSLFTINQLFLMFFVCTPDSTTPGNTHNYYNYYYPNMQCFTPTWWKLAAGGIGIFSIYVMTGLGVIVRLSIVRRRLQDQAVIAVYGPFYESYRLRCWWFDGVVLLRRVAMAVAQGTLTAYPVMQSFCFLFVMLASLIVQIHFLPFRQRAVNVIETMSLCCIAIVASAYEAIGLVGYDVPNISRETTIVAAVVIMITLAAYVLAITVALCGACSAFCCANQKCPRARGLWRHMDYAFAPHDDKIDEQEKMMQDAAATERTPLIARGPINMASSTGTLEQAVGSLMTVIGEETHAGGHLKNALAAEAGSEAREYALLEAFTSYVATSEITRRKVGGPAITLVDATTVRD